MWIWCDECNLRYDLQWLEVQMHYFVTAVSADTISLRLFLCAITRIIIEKKQTIRYCNVYRVFKMF